MKKYLLKTIVICIIFLFIGIAVKPVTAFQKTNDFTEEKNNLNFSIISYGKTQTINKISINNEQLNELKNILSSLIEKLQNSKNNKEIIEIIKDLQIGKNRNLLSILFAPLNMIKRMRNSQFIISIGSYYNLNPFKNTKTTSSLPIHFWHYSGESVFKLPSQTVIIEKKPFKIKDLQGPQFGIMTRFKGIYVYISNPFPEKSYSFFIGTSFHSVGIDFDFPDINIPEINFNLN